MFSIYIPSSTVASFDGSRQKALCNAITAGWDTPGPISGVSCTVGSVSSFNGSSVLASGFAYYTWTVTPEITVLNAAVAARDNRVDALNSNINSVLGGSFPGAIPNCACDGMNDVTASSTSPAKYDTSITGLYPFENCLCISPACS